MTLDPAIPKRGFLLSHRHSAGECGTAYAAWRGFDSPLRHGPVLASCSGEPVDGADHVLVWTVDAVDAGDALAMLPPWVAERTEVRGVDEARLP